MTFSETFLVFLVILVVFGGVKFGFRKSCLCKRNDKYKVCPCYQNLPKTFKHKVNVCNMFAQKVENISSSSPLSPGLLGSIKK